MMADKPKTLICFYREDIEKEFGENVQCTDSLFENVMPIKAVLKEKYDKMMESCHKLEVKHNELIQYSAKQCTDLVKYDELKEENWKINKIYSLSLETISKLAKASEKYKNSIPKEKFRKVLDERTKFYDEHEPKGITEHFIEQGALFELIELKKQLLGEK